MRQLSDATVVLPYTLLFIATLGVIVSWIRPTGIPRWLLPATIFLALPAILYFGTWSGFASRVDLNYFSIGGRVPHSDAGAYFLGTFEVGFTGQWGVLSSYRPLASGMRAFMTALAGLDYPTSMMLQAFLLAATLSIAAQRILIWLGPWAALAFAGFVLIMIRPFIGTAMTESSALMFALCAVTFLADALRTRCFYCAAMSLLLMSAAEVTRQGAVLIIPTMMMWVFLAHFDRSAWIRRSALIATAALAPFILAEVLRALYASPNIASTGNMAYVLCATARATTWLECSDRIAAQGISPNDAERFSRALLSLAWQSLLAEPSRAATVLSANLKAYFSGVATFMLQGYGNHAFVMPSEIPRAMVCFCSIGIFVQFIRAPRDIAFWFCSAVAIAISASLILTTDGWRALYATHPLIALFFATGWRSGVADLGVKTYWRPAAAIAPLMAASLVACPAILHLTMRHAPSDDLYGRAITGFIVIPDGWPKPSAPSVEASEFVAMIAATSLEQEFGSFSKPIGDIAPISVFWTAQIGFTNQATLVYFGPIDVLRAHTRENWHFTYRKMDWQLPTGATRVIETANTVP